MKTICLIALSAVYISALASVLPFTEPFETPAVTNGAINGQNEWMLTGGTNAIVQTDAVQSGSQALKIQNSQVAHALSNTQNSVWLSFHARITAAPDINPVVTNANTSIAFFVDTNRYLVVYSGTNQIVLSSQIPVAVWTRFDIYCDYARTNWMISVNGTNAAYGLSLYSDNRQLQSVLIDNNSTNAVYFDELAVQEVEPTNLVANIDKDRDGLPDWWEQHYFGSITNAATNSVGSNGLTLLQSYIAGLNPGDAADTFDLTRLAEKKFSWVRKSGRQYDVYWTSNLTSGFTYIETAAGSEFEDTSTNRTLKPSGFYQIRVH